MHTGVLCHYVLTKTLGLKAKHLICCYFVRVLVLVSVKGTLRVIGSPPPLKNISQDRGKPWP